MAPFGISAATLLANFAVLSIVPAVLGHGGEEMDMNIGTEAGVDQAKTEQSYPATYFAFQEHRAAIYAHISLMVVSWVVLLPIVVMLSLARSRYTAWFRLVFIALDALAILLGVIYNASTPDLYPNNAHSKLGWTVTWVVLAQAVVGPLGRVVGMLKSAPNTPRPSARGEACPLVSTEAARQRERVEDARFQRPLRISSDSRPSNEPNNELPRKHSASSLPMTPIMPYQNDDGTLYDDNQEDDSLEAHSRTSIHPGARQAWTRKTGLHLLRRARKALIYYYNFVERTILILGFIALCTGIVAFGRFFEGKWIFNGLAHWIKGGVFFWLGILTVGRWSGCFGEIGWAWNIRPRTEGQKWRPSAEFVESAVIFFYGSTNIFLEHLSGWGGQWSAEDLEHISITVLFIGGGLCGMLIESTRIRELLNTNVTEAAHDEKCNELAPPRQYSFSMNPIPALVILLWGIMMGSHTQGTMTSSIIHKQWGHLLAGASFARALTYVIMYLKPPRSILPSRPPTELLTSFGLIAGGIIFMASSRDTVAGMIHYELDVMVIYTVVIGFVGLLMAWVITLIALKGWAIRKETGPRAVSYSTV